MWIQVFVCWSVALLKEKNMINVSRAKRLSHISDIKLSSSSRYSRCVSRRLHFIWKYRLQTIVFRRCTHRFLFAQMVNSLVDHFLNCQRQLTSFASNQHFFLMQSIACPTVCSPPCSWEHLLRFPCFNGCNNSNLRDLAIAPKRRLYH